MYAFEKEKKNKLFIQLSISFLFIGSMNKYEVLDIVGKKKKKLVVENETMQVVVLFLWKFLGKLCEVHVHWNIRENLGLLEVEIEIDVTTPRDALLFNTFKFQLTLTLEEFKWTREYPLEKGKPAAT